MNDPTTHRLAFPGGDERHAAGAADAAARRAKDPQPAPVTRGRTHTDAVVLSKLRRTTGCATVADLKQSMSAGAEFRFRLARLLRKRGMYAIDFAEATGVGESVVGGWLRGVIPTDAGVKSYLALSGEPAAEVVSLILTEVARKVGQGRKRGLETRRDKLLALVPVAERQAVDEAAPVSCAHARPAGRSTEDTARAAEQAPHTESPVVPAAANFVRAGSPVLRYVRCWSTAICSGAGHEPVHFDHQADAQRCSDVYGTGERAVEVTMPVYASFEAYESYEAKRGRQATRARALAKLTPDERASLGVA